MSSKVSFTVRPPARTFETDTPETSRPGSASPDSDTGIRLPHRPVTSSPLATSSTRPKPGKRQWESYTGPDSSDDDEPETEEMITGFDAMGVQRLDESKHKPKGPLVIPAQKNRDWRAESMARKRQAMNGFVPDSARVATGKDGSQGGLGTLGKINDGPQLSGLVVNIKQEAEAEAGEADVEMEEVKEEPDVKEEELDEDQRALRALLRGSDGDEKNKVEIAPIRVEDGPAWNQPKSEADAFKEDLASRPDEATLADYERVPIELFGEAMLRGMGHIPGKAASKSGAGRVEPYIPESRPALLGIGAKPRPQDELEGKDGKKRFLKPDKRYVPIAKVERNGSSSSSQRPSRSRSGSPGRGSRRERDSDRRESYRDERHERDRDRDRDRDGRRDKDKDRDRDRRDRDYDSDRTRDRRRDYESDRDRERDRDRRRDHDSDRDRRRDYDSDRDRERRRDRDRDHDSGRRR